jgi:DNA helicase-2/ATP-dependent DNA helicase PcrA
VIRRTGLRAEIDAGQDAEVAAARARNLAAFLDEVHAFSPVEGELTLRAFLDYVDAVEESDKPEWSPVQPSEENSVKVMTIHQAKGLEFDSVFVPGVAKGLLPSNQLQHNPATRGKSMDFELRGDADVLPKLEDFGGVVSRFWQALKDQELIEERRTCYVALTRARHRLFVSGAHWYGETDRPKKPSEFLDELAEWGEESGLAVVDRGPEQDEDNPLRGYRERLVRDWPGPPRRDAPDELFPQGDRAAGLEGRAPGDVLASLSPEERRAYDEAAGAHRALAAEIEERERRQAAPPWMPPSIAVGALVDYGRCPKRFYWSAVRPLPRFSGPAARIGTEIHRWIERRSSGQASLIELEEEPDLTAEELAGEPGRIERLREAFLRSRFAGRVPLFTERPFLLNLGGFVVSGRIDAVYGSPDGPWEIVDYKTGRRPDDDDDPLVRLQLDLYALACVDVWGKHPEDLTVTYSYLQSGDESTRPAGDVEATRQRAVDALRRMAAGRFDATPGGYCRWCDFLSFCEPGRAFVGAE